MHAGKGDRLYLSGIPGKSWPVKTVQIVWLMHRFLQEIPTFNRVEREGLASSPASG